MFVYTHKKIRIQLFAQLRRELSSITIVTPFLQDFKFKPGQLLSDLLWKQAAYGAQITILTQPPPADHPSTFRTKYHLLEKLRIRKAEIIINPNIHAKMYIFRGKDGRIEILFGSANLTRGGLRELLEVVVLCAREEDVRQFESVCTEFLKNYNSRPLIRWKVTNNEEIHQIIGGL